MNFSTPSVVCLGTAVIDLIGVVSHFPNPEEKIRSLFSQTVVGGNCLNASICISRLNFSSKLICKIGADFFGKEIQETLKKEKVDCSFIVNVEDKPSSYSYVIVDKSNNTRTCINNSILDDLVIGEVNLIEALKHSLLLVLDGKHCEFVFKTIEKIENKRDFFILLDAEVGRMKNKYFEEIISFSNFVKCNQSFISNYFEGLDLLEGIFSLLEKKGRKKNWVIMTMGSFGSLMMLITEKKDLKRIESFHQLNLVPSSSKLTIEEFKYKEHGHLIYCSAYSSIAENEKNSTGCGDVFLGACSYGIVKQFSPEKLLQLSSFIAGKKCEQHGILGIPFLKEIPTEFL